MQVTTCKLQHASYNMQVTTCKLQHAGYNMQVTTCIIQQPVHYLILMILLLKLENLSYPSHNFAR